MQHPFVGGRDDHRGKPAAAGKIVDLRRHVAGDAYDDGHQDCKTRELVEPHSCVIKPGNHRLPPIVSLVAHRDTRSRRDLGARLVGSVAAGFPAAGVQRKKRQRSVEQVGHWHQHAEANKPQWVHPLRGRRRSAIDGVRDAHQAQKQQMRHRQSKKFFIDNMVKNHPRVTPKQRRHRHVMQGNPWLQLPHVGDAAKKIHHIRSTPAQLLR